MDGDGDDLEIIDPEPDPGADSYTPSPPISATRPRASRWWLAAATALVLAGGSFAGTAFVHRTRHRDPRRSAAATHSPATAVPSFTSAFTLPIAIDPDAEFIDQMAMIAPGVGWALNGYALYRTVDDTAHWTNITPPGVVNPSAHTFAIDFLDADHAWMATALDSHPLTIHRTTDGGRTWQSIRPNVCGSGSSAAPEELSCGFPLSIDFTDPADGWALFSPEHVKGTLITTHDGGRTWTIVGPTPFVGTLHFADAHTGWGISESDGTLWRTTDGGKTWRTVDVPTSATGAAFTSPIGTPQTFGLNTVIAGRLAVSRTAPTEIIVSVSHDAGLNWSTRAVPALPASDRAGNVDNPALFEFSASSPSDWAIILASQISVTHDAGRNWSVLMPTGAPVRDLDFATPSSAWLLAQTQLCPSPPVDGCNDTVLLRTEDGGTSWHSASPVLAVTAARSP